MCVDNVNVCVMRLTVLYSTTILYLREKKKKMKSERELDTRLGNGCVGPK
jgi:hypothetical protein